VYPAPYFFPLGPEISEHWFKSTKRLDVESMLGPDAYLVHWYASVRTKHIVPTLNRETIRAQAQSVALSALASRFLDGES
jgi:hypothetical protein